jgi:hypothetical protein
VLYGISWDAKLVRHITIKCGNILLSSVICQQNIGCCLVYAVHSKGQCVPMIEAASLWVKKCNTCSTLECRLPTDCTGTSQWRCHNCSCGTRAMELTQYHKRTGTNSIESLKYFVISNFIHFITRWVYNCFQSIVLYGCNFANDYNINTMWISFFTWHYVDKLSMFTCEGVLNIHNSHLWAQDNHQEIHDRG